MGDPHIQVALNVVQPSAKREGFATVPDITWDDVGALEGIREELSIAILVCCWATLLSLLHSPLFPPPPPPLPTPYLPLDGCVS